MPDTTSSSSEPPTDPRVPSDEGADAVPGHGTLPSPSPLPPAWTSHQDSPEGGRYRPHSFHKSGGMGRVWRAHDTELSRDVAFKEIHPELADRDDVRRRFVFEAEVTGRLQHPAVIPVYGFGWNAFGRPYYAMRFVEGLSLQEAIHAFHAATGPVGAERAVALRRLLGHFVTVCRAVDYAHSRGVIHRDLKPANVMVGKYGETLVVDWGIAKRLRTAVGESEAAPDPDAGPPDPNRPLRARQFGTPPFWSPEQAAGAPELHDERTDVYGLGAVLFTLLTGVSPHPNGVHFPEPPGPQAMCPWVDAGIDDITRTALALDRADRYPTAAELAAAVEVWLADQPVLAQRVAVSALERAAKAHPNDVALAEQFARQRSNLGLMLAGMGRDANAETEFRAAADVFARLAASNNQPRFFAEQAGVLLALARSYTALGRKDLAKAAEQEAAELYTRLVATRPGEYKPDFAAVMMSGSQIEFELPDHISFSDLPPVLQPDAEDTTGANSPKSAALPPRPTSRLPSPGSFDFIDLGDVQLANLPTSDVAAVLPPAPNPDAVFGNLQPVDPVAPADGWLDADVPLAEPAGTGSVPDIAALFPASDAPSTPDIDSLFPPSDPPSSFVLGQAAVPPALPPKAGGSSFDFVLPEGVGSYSDLPPIPVPEEEEEPAVGASELLRALPLSMPIGDSVPDIGTLFPQILPEPVHASTPVPVVPPTPVAEPAAFLSLSSGYTRVRDLAQGGMGRLWLARDDNLNRSVVIKTLADQYAADSRAARRFRREMQITGSLEHPNLVRAYTSGTGDDGRPYLVLEYLNGNTLLHRLEVGGPGWTPALLDPLAQACDGLHYAHTRGIVHRDAKLANIIVLPERTVLLDWGLGKVLGQQDPQDSGVTLTGDAPTPDDAMRSRAGSLVGTPAYMAPEQARGEAGAIGPRTDVFALGANLFHLVTGRAPGEEDELRTMITRRRTGDIPRLCDVRPNVPPQLDAICTRAIAFKPEDRYPTAAAFAVDLRAFLADLNPETGTESD